MKRSHLNCIKLAKSETNIGDEESKALFNVTSGLNLFLSELVLYVNSASAFLVLCLEKAILLNGKS